MINLKIFYSLNLFFYFKFDILRLHQTMQWMRRFSKQLQIMLHTFLVITKLLMYLSQNRRKL